MSELENFLRQQAESIIKDDGFCAPNVVYSEDTNDDALTDDWLENQTSYIWKVGTLTIVDGNKADWAYMFIGHLRGQGYQPEFIGKLYWADGENDDIGRCLARYLKTLNNFSVHSVFEPH